MSLQPHSSLPQRRSAKRASTPPTSRKLEGLSGETELRQSAEGFWQVWPRPTPASQRELYQEQFYESDKANYLSDMELERPYWDAIWTLRREMMEAALPPDRRRLLDVGCSGGFLLDHFQQHGWQSAGIEPSPQAAHWARDQFGVEVFCGDLLDESDLAANESFDAIHSSQVLEHVLEPEACVAKIAQLLAPEGIAFIEVPNDFNLIQETARKKLDTKAWWVAPDHHLNYFDYDSLSKLLDRSGLEEIDRIASFPIEMFLLMGDDYIGDPSLGKACHQRRMRFEQSLIESGRVAELGTLYRALAQAGMGRTCGILARKR